MPTTIYDASQITKRRGEKATSGSFIRRIQNPTDPTTGSAPLLGISSQSIINAVKTGQMTEYRKNDGGCVSISPGCPCNLAAIIEAVAAVPPSIVTNIDYSYGSIILTWGASSGTDPITYSVNLIPQSQAGLGFIVYSNYFNGDPLWFNSAVPVGSPNSGQTSDFSTIASSTPGVNLPGSYSVEWFGYFLATESGKFIFRNTSVNNSFVWIGPTALSGYDSTNALITNIGGSQPVDADINLISGNYYPIRIQTGKDTSFISSFNLEFSLPSNNTTFISNGSYFFASPSQLILGSTPALLYEFTNNQLTQGTNYLAYVYGSNSVGVGPVLFLGNNTNPTPILGLYNPPTISVVAVNDDNLVLGYSNPGFTVTQIETTLSTPLPSGWTISAPNVPSSGQFTLTNATGINPANIPGIKFVFKGASLPTEETYPSVAVTVTTLGYTPSITLGASTATTCTLNYTYPNLGAGGFTVTGVTASPPPLPTGWSASANNSNIVLTWNGSGSAIFSNPVAFSLTGAGGLASPSSNTVANIHAYGPVNVTSVTPGTDQCTLTYSYPDALSGVGFDVVTATTDLSTSLPSGWSILSADNTTLILQKPTSVNPASIPTGIKFILQGATQPQEQSYPSAAVTGISTLGFTPSISQSGGTQTTAILSIAGPYPLANAGGIDVTNAITDLSTPLPSNWSITSANNSTILLTWDGTGTSLISSGIKFKLTDGVVNSPLSNTVSGINTVNGWATSINGVGSDGGTGIVTDSSGNTYVIGSYTYDSLTPLTIKNFNSVSGTTINTTVFGTLPNPPSGGTDIFIVKYDVSGTALWATNMTGTGFDGSYKIALDSTGNVYVTGYYQSNPVTINSFTSVSGTTINTSTFGTLTSSGQLDTFVVKYDTNGTALWATNMAGTGFEVGSGIAVDSSDNVYVTGSYDSPQLTINSFTSVSGTIINTSTFGILPSINSGTDIFIVKYDTNGTVLWATNMTGGNNSYSNQITVDSTGNVYIVGQTFVSSGGGTITVKNFDSVSGGTINTSTFGSISIVPNSYSTFTVKYDTNGTALWATNNTGTFGVNDSNGIAVDSTGNVYICGYYSLFMTINSFTSVSGTTINTSTFGSLNGISPTDGFIMKYDPNGTVLWVTNIVGSGAITGDEEPYGISVDSTGNVYITGLYESTLFTINSFNNVSGGTINTTVFGTLTINGTSNAFVAKYDTNGTALWATDMTGTGNNNRGNEITVDSSGNVYVTGQYNASPLTINNFNNVSGGTINTTVYGTLANIGGLDAFIVKYNTNGQVL
jgi:hypothetical protein